jgi:hypothetical protein
MRVSGQPVKVSGLELDQGMILGAQSGAAVLILDHDLDLCGRSTHGYLLVLGDLRDHLWLGWYLPSSRLTVVAAFC